MKVIKTLAVFFSFVAFAAVVAGVQAQDRRQDHDELRAMLKTVTDAMNSRDINRACFKGSFLKPAKRARA